MTAKKKVSAKRLKEDLFQKQAQQLEAKKIAIKAQDSLVIKLQEAVLNLKHSLRVMQDANETRKLELKVKNERILHLLTTSGRAELDAIKVIDDLRVQIMELQAKNS